MHPKHDTYTNLSNWLDDAKISVSKVIDTQPNHLVAKKAQSVQDFLDRETKRHEKELMAKEQFEGQEHLQNVADIVNEMNENHDDIVKVEAAYEYLRDKDLVK